MASRTAPWFKPAPAPSNWGVRLASMGYGPGTQFGPNPMGGFSFNPPKVEPPPQPVAAPSQWQPQPVGGGIRAGLASIQGQPMPVQTGLMNLPPGVTGTFGGQPTIGQPPGPPVGDIPGQFVTDVEDKPVVQQQPPAEEEGEIVAQKRDENGNLWVAFKTGEGKITWRLAPKQGTQPKTPSGVVTIKSEDGTSYVYNVDAEGNPYGNPIDKIPVARPGDRYKPVPTTWHIENLGDYQRLFAKDAEGREIADTVTWKNVPRTQFKPGSKVINDPNTGASYIEVTDANGNVSATPLPAKKWNVMPGSEKKFFKGAEAGAPGGPALPGRLSTQVQMQDEQGNLVWKTLKEEPFATTQWNSPETQQRLALERGHEAESERLNKQFGYGAGTAAQNIYNIQQPQNWIQKQTMFGGTPTTPPELANILGQQVGKPLQRKSVPFLSMNQWQAMTPEIQTSLMGYLKWIGIDPNQWIADMQNLWQSGRPTPGLRWGTAKQ